MASKKNGIMTTIISSAAALEEIAPRRRKNSGTPTRMPQPKQTTCRLVKLKMNLVLTFVKSLGTVTYAICNTSFLCFT